MSDQLTVTHPSGNTLYAILRHADSAQAFNLETNELETWNPANRSDYAISLTDMSGDLYRGTFPSAAPEAGWRVHFYRQTGIAASATDPVVAFAVAAWTGTDLVDIDLAELSAQALCSLAELKRHLRLDTDVHDALSIDCINGVSGWLGLVTGRKFVLQGHVETRRIARGDATLALEHHPVVGPVAAFVSDGPGLKIRRTAAALRASVTAGADGLALGWTDTSGQRHETTLSYTTYPTLSSLAAAVSLEAGWTAAALMDAESFLLQNSGAVEAHKRDVTLEIWRETDLASEVNSESGVMSLNKASGCTGRVRLAYRAGYDPIPHDIRQLAVRLASRVYHAGRHDPNLARESLGEYAASLDTASALAVEEQAAISRLSDLKPA